MYNPAAAAANFAHSFSISSLMNAAAAASADKFDLNSYSQIYQQQGVVVPSSGVVQSGGLVVPSAAAAAAANDYYSMYQQHNI